MWNDVAMPCAVRRPEGELRSLFSTIDIHQTCLPPSFCIFQMVTDAVAISARVVYVCPCSVLTQTPTSSPLCLHLSLCNAQSQRAAPAGALPNASVVYDLCNRCSSLSAYSCCMLPCCNWRQVISLQARSSTALAAPLEMYMCIKHVSNMYWSYVLHMYCTLVVS